MTITGPPIPPAPKAPVSERAQRLASQWSPPVVAAVIAALGTVAAAWVTGAFRAPDMSETNAVLRELANATRELKRWQERHDDKHEALDKRDQDRRREVDSRFTQQQREIDRKADVIAWRIR